MKWITFQILLISLSSVWSARYCAMTRFQPNVHFDHDKERMGYEAITMHENAREDAPCFVSFHVAKLSKNHTDFKSISECVSLYTGDGHVIAHWFGNENYKVEEPLKEAGCYYQADWIFCVCFHNYCNSPEYWSLLVSTFYHKSKALGRGELSATAQTLLYPEGPLGSLLKKHNFPKIDVDTTAAIHPSQLRCLIWFVDMVAQKNLDQPFYLFNYITERADAPSVERFGDPRLVDKKEHNTSRVFEFVSQPEPFAKEPMDKRNGLPVSAVEALDGRFLFASLYVGAASLIGFIIVFSFTFYMLRKLCQRLQHEDHFSRNNSTKSRLRYEALIYPATVPPEFTKKQNPRVKIFKRKSTNSK